MDQSVENMPLLERRADAIRFGASKASDPGRAVRELHDLIWQPDIAFVIFFSSPEYDRKELQEAISGTFGDLPVVGCTTAGEITPGGYAEGSITAVSFSARHFRMESRLIKDVSSQGISQCSQIARDLVADFPPPGRMEYACPAIRRWPASAGGCADCRARCRSCAHPAFRRLGG